MLSRRGLITGLISFVAAPAIVRAASLMSVKAIKTAYPWTINGVEIFFDDEVSPEMIALLHRRFKDAEAAMNAHITQLVYRDDGGEYVGGLRDLIA